jgi:hypothetical protein
MKDVLVHVPSSHPAPERVRAILDQIERALTDSTVPLRSVTKAWRMIAPNIRITPNGVSEYSPVRCIHRTGGKRCKRIACRGGVRCSQHGGGTLAKLCRCAAYSYPHRPGSGNCQWPAKPAKPTTARPGQHSKQRKRAMPKVLQPHVRSTVAAGRPPALAAAVGAGDVSKSIRRRIRSAKQHETSPAAPAEGRVTMTEQEQQDLYNEARAIATGKPVFKAMPPVEVSQPAPEPTAAELNELREQARAHASRKAG